MLGVVLHRFAPCLRPGRTAFPLLSQIDRELSQYIVPGAALAALDRSKPELHGRLRARHPEPVAQALVLKTQNLLLARYHLRTRSVRVRSRPFGLVVDPSNACQLACPGCVHSERAETLKVFDWPMGTLSARRLDSLFRLYGPYAIAVYFCSYGEPLLNLETPKFIRLAKSYLLAAALSTSLSVRRLDAEAFVESGLDFMVLSIDGATQRVYERFRRHGNLDLVLDNVRKLVETKRRLRSRTPALCWNFLAFEHNVREIPLAIRLARKLGVDQFRVAIPFDVGWDDPEIRPAAVRSSVRRLHWRTLYNQPGNWNPFPESVNAGAIARAFDRRWSEDDTGESPAGSCHTCHWLYKNIVMDATGRIMPCCGAPSPDAALVFAHIESDGDPFNSERYRQARSFFSTGAVAANSPPYCARCDWDHTTVNIGPPEIRRYFRAADPAFFDRRSLRLLAEW